MPVYSAPVRDFSFLLHEWLKVQDRADLPGFNELSADFTSAIWGEGAKFCEEVLFPLNQKGDSVGLAFDKGNVTTPPGWKEAYQSYVQGGWVSLTCDPAYGGQGLPEVMNLPLIEMVCSANLSFGITPGLSHGAHNAIYLHASDALKQQYLPKMVSGEWAGVMCLTEPQAGTDLGLIKTTATPRDDGSYSISGNKIFISSGEQDLTENIIHLVLARLPDAPKGIKGISLFLVPKRLVNKDGSCGEKNKVSCAAIEHKMGIHASPTCVMNYEDATGYLVGTPHKGMKAMFTMMNAARLYVGIQGLGLAEVAYQNALSYARERLQSRAPKGPVAPGKPADPIIAHPDVRRMLLTVKAFTESARALSLKTALLQDIAHRHPDAATRAEADDFIQLITPILKAYLTDGGFESASTAMQVFGGYGYIKEYGVEQYVRDARIAMIYEGTNGIQALDLIGRKLSHNYGQYLRRFFQPLERFMEENKGVKEMEPFLKPLAKNTEYLKQGTLWIAKAGLGNPDDAASGATEYLKLFALVTMGWIWAEMAKVSMEKLSSGASDAAFYQSKIATAKFYMQKILPQCASMLMSITAGSKSIMELEAEGF